MKGYASITMGLLLAGMAILTLPQTAPADWHGGGGWHGGGWHGGVHVGVGFYPRYYGYYGPYYGYPYYYGPSVVYAPSPVYVVQQPAPVVVQAPPPSPVVVQGPPAQAAPDPAPANAPPPADAPPAPQAAAPAAVQPPVAQPPAPQPQTIMVDGKVADLIGMLQHGDDGDRKKAAKELKHFNMPVVVTVLINALRSDGNSHVRKYAAASLGDLMARDARPALRQAAREDRDEGVRDAALKSARRIEDAFGPS